MAALAVNGNVIVTTCGAQTFAVRLGEDSVNTLQPPRLKNKPADEDNQKFVTAEQKETQNNIVCADLSRCSKWLVLCSNSKQLSLWSVNNWSLVSNRPLVRTASKVKFTPTSRSIVIADKSGDAYLYSIDNPDECGKMLLGHLSMLLDVLVSDDEKFIITCDRDEKIRVSSFPNAYNVQSYCLGHTQFVSCIHILPHCPNVLISGSGDGTLRLWDYMDGTEMHVVDCTKEISNYHDFTSEANDCNLEQLQQNMKGCYSTCAVKQFHTHKLDKSTSIIAVAISNLNGCAIFEVAGEMPNLSLTLVQILSIGIEPWDIALSDFSVFWCLGLKDSEPLHVFQFNADNHLYEPYSESSSSAIKNAVCLINNNWELFKSVSAPTLTPTLYKRKIDNVQEYRKRKTARLSSSAS